MQCLCACGGVNSVFGVDVVWCVFGVIGVDVVCRVCDVFGIYVVGMHLVSLLFMCWFHFFISLMYM